jgi:1,4-dihydroxy-2-naphthoate octaprenyltransferase
VTEPETLLPAPVRALLDVALVGELTVIDASGRPVTYPLIPLSDGKLVYLTSSVLFSRKLRHIKANPKVCFSLTDPVAISVEPFSRATIQGDARIVEEDLHAGWENLLPLWRAKEPAIDFFLKKRFGIPLFFERSVIEITPAASCGGRTVGPMGRHACTSWPGSPDMARLDISDAITRAQSYPHAVLAYVGPDGYPVNVAVDFTASPDHVVEVGPLGDDWRPAAEQEVELTFSHIRPQPGIGYDERRYINLWGRAVPAGPGLRVAVGRATGWDEADTPFFEYAERGVAEGRTYLDDVGARPRLSRWWTFFLATRLPFLTATVIPVGLGGVVAARDNSFHTLWFVLALLAAIAVHLGLNMANDLFDDASGADAANLNPTPFSGGSRVLQYGLVHRRSMLLGCAAFYTVAVGLGLYLAAERGWALVAVGAVGVGLSLAYSAPPLRLVHRGLGEPVTALGFGPVMTVGTYFACTGRWSWQPFLASLPVALLIALVLYVNQIPDRTGDAAVGKSTLIVRWTPAHVQAGYALAAAAAFLCVVAEAASGVTPAWTLLALATAPLAWRVWRGLRAHYAEPYALIPTMQTNIALHLLTGLLLIVGYTIAVLA